MSKVKPAPKSRAQIQREYRARLKEKNEEEALKKEQLRWHKRVSEKRVKLVADLSARELRQKRKEWRAKKAETRRIQKRPRSLQTPPQTPSTSEDRQAFSERVHFKALIWLDTKSKPGCLTFWLITKLSKG